MKVSNKLEGGGRSPAAAKALQMAFIFDAATAVLVLIHWFIFWFTNALEIFGIGVKLPGQFYTWIGMLSWMVLGGAAVVNILVDKKAGGKPKKTFILRIAGHSLFLIYALIVLFDIAFPIQGLEFYTGMWKLSLYMVYLNIIVSLVGLIFPIVKGMNKLDGASGEKF
jgi:hypothetical protein